MIQGAEASAFQHARARIEQGGALVLGGDFDGSGTPDGSLVSYPFSYSGSLDPGTYTVIVSALALADVQGSATATWNFEFSLGTDPPPGLSAEIDWVTVGDPGNACDPQPDGCFGTVGYEYRIGRFEVTNFQYAAFLNAVAATDTYGLFPPPPGLLGLPSGIDRFGSPGSYSYQAQAGRETHPVVRIDVWSMMRFANWLHHVKPTGPQGADTTEDGAYTMTAQGIANNTIVRNPEASVFIASEDEWFKATYYDPTQSIYYDLPTGTDAPPASCVAPTAVPNSANCNYAVVDLTPAGSYPGSPSAMGTFDQAANAAEITDTIRGAGRVSRGGAFDVVPRFQPFLASVRLGAGSETAGFRVASLPAAAPVPSARPVALGVLVMAISIFGAWRIRALRSV